MPKAIWNDKVVAESDQTEVVDGNHYFPADSIHADFFKESDTTTVCGWKGTAHYYHLVVDSQENKDAVWCYPDPKPAADNIKGYYAFWKGVEVQD